MRQRTLFSEDAAPGLDIELPPDFWRTLGVDMFVTNVADYSSIFTPTALRPRSVSLTSLVLETNSTGGWTTQGGWDTHRVAEATAGLLAKAAGPDKSRLLVVRNSFEPPSVVEDPNRGDYVLVFA